MARMIPPVIDTNCTSPGEREVFGDLRSDPVAADWTVLHSFGVAEHPTRGEGEVDFVVLVPGAGVVCLEVKGGNVRRDDGVWYYGTGAHEKACTRGPFRQAAEGMHGLRTHVARADPELAGVMFFSGVVFTRVDFDQRSPEWHDWQVADRRTVLERGVPGFCLDLLERAHERVAACPEAKWYRPAASRPDARQIERLVALLRGDFEFFVTPRVQVEQAERTIRRFTAEQYRALDMIEDNERVLFRGPAGTGKTVLALEAARRFALAGKRTGLFCFNRMLAEWLVEEARQAQSPKAPIEWVNTFHHYLVDKLAVDPSCEWGAEVWSNELPDMFVEKVLGGELPVPAFDAIVIDEVQDLLTPRFLDVFDTVLKGGLAHGRWAMFGDLERQAIYASHDEGEMMDLAPVLGERSPHYVRMPLRRNCRNCAPIAETVERAFGMSPGYDGVLEEAAGPAVKVQVYRNAREQRRALRKALKRAGELFTNGEIMVLSFRNDGDCCAADAQEEDPSLKLNPLRLYGPDSGSVGYCTVHSFKGMEAPAVILTDVDGLGAKRMRGLLYVGMTRARIQLSIIMHQDSQPIWLKMTGQG